LFSKILLKTKINGLKEDADRLGPCCRKFCKWGRLKAQ
jgi:hypothetical protein